MDAPTLTGKSPLEIAGRVHVDWIGLRPNDPTPAVLAHAVVRDADTGEPITGGTSVTIRCAGGENPTALVELTELLDTDGRPLRKGRQWSQTDETKTSTYLLALADRQRASTTDFGWALEQLRAGRRVTRTGWNGVGQWLLLVPGSNITIEAGRPLGDAAPHLVGEAATYAPHIDIATFKAGAVTLTPWLASQTDLLATDWTVLPGGGA